MVRGGGRLVVFNRLYTKSHSAASRGLLRAISTPVALTVGVPCHFQQTHPCTRAVMNANSSADGHSAPIKSAYVAPALHVLLYD